MRVLRSGVRLAFVTGFLLTPASGADAQQFLGKRLSAWGDDLRARDAAVRRSAAFALGKAGAQATGWAADLLEALRNDPDAGVREAAAFALGEIGPTAERDALAVLGRALAEDRDPDVRRSAAYALGCYGRFAAPHEADLRKALLDRASPGLRQNAAWALGQLGREAEAKTVAALGEALADPEPLVRRDAAAALGHIGRPAARPAVGPLAECARSDPDAVVRKHALQALVNTVGPEDRASARDLQAVLRKLQDDYHQGKADAESVRDAAIALGSVGGPEAAAAVGVLRPLLKEGDAAQRLLASAALANIGPAAAPALRDLAAALKDSEVRVRLNAALALGRLKEQGRDAVADVLQALEGGEPDEDVRRYLVEAISSIGKEVPAAVVQALPTLRRLIREDDKWRVRQRAVFALINLDDLARPERADVVKDLVAVLAESDPNTRLVRYEAAIILAVNLRERSPDVVLDVLHANLTDPHIKVYVGTTAAVSGAGAEKTGTAGVTEVSEGDPRWMPVVALGAVGPRVAQREDIMKSIREAAQSKDAKLRKHAEEALKLIDRK
jgi:HEAT repeat protein